jgi:ATP-dependent Clp protease ATP-binding subunit ClpB
MKLLKASVRPEFLNRIDEIVLFDPLGRNEIRKIVAIQFDAIKARLQEQGILIEATAAALDKLGEEGYDPVFGARPLKRVIQRNIMNELSKMILGGTINKEAIIVLDVDDENHYKFENLQEIKIA